MCNYTLYNQFNKINQYEKIVNEKSIFAKDKFIKFCKNKYCIDVMMDDYNHILKQHKAEFAQIGDELHKKYGFAKCDRLAHKRFTMNDEELKDKQFVFYIHFYDQCHQLFYHVIGTDFEIKRMEIKLNDDEVWTDSAQDRKNENNVVKFTVEMYDPLGIERYGKCIVAASYSDSETVNHIMDKINKYLNDKYNPTIFKINKIEGKKSFTKETIFPGILIEFEETLTITQYDKNNIIEKGLYFQVEPHHIHKPKVNDIISNYTCENMQKLKSDDALHCPIYYSMKEEQEYTEENLNHVNEFTHFTDAYSEKPECKFGDECKSLKQLENTNVVIELNDKCHLKLFRHPPRKGHLKLSENIHSFIFDKQQDENVE
eukprot:54009_1